ncbi:MAG: hypothetical protein MJY82_01405 [Fibrobacter sp.]|nr:hypothetical protein [Fibrobacter sp.]
MSESVVESFFRISPPLNISTEYFKYRKEKNKDNWYITELNDVLDPNKTSDIELREAFWTRVDDKLSKAYGERSANRRKYRNEQGCYIFTWGTTPIYIGMAGGRRGFFQECFAKHKRDLLKDFFCDKNWDKKTYKNHLHLYLIFWNGKTNKILNGRKMVDGKEVYDKKGSLIYTMETYLIIRAIQEGFLDNLLNTDKTNFAWCIKGFFGSIEGAKKSSKWPEHQEQCLKNLKKVFAKQPRKDI